MQPGLINNPETEPKPKDKRGGPRPGSGRPPGALSAATKKINEAKATLRDLALQHVPNAVETLADIAKNSTSDQAKVAAIKELFDRAYGRSPQAITGENGGPVRQAIEITWATGQSAQN
jgi:hypothetical protein